MITHKQLFTQLYTKPTKNFNIYEASDKSAGKAAYILIVAHFIPLVVLVSIWLISLLPFFEAISFSRLIHQVLAFAAFIVGIIAITMSFAAFGFWGTVITAGKGSEGDSLERFSAVKGNALGWLRWLLQLVIVGGFIITVMLTMGNVRIWQLLPNPESRIGLTAKTAQLPAKVPANWDLKYAEDGVNDWPSDTTLSYSMRYNLSPDSDFNQVKSWVTSTNWEALFGTVRKTVCDDDLENCTLYFERKQNVSPGSDLPDKFEYKLHTYFTSYKTRPDKSVRIQVRATYIY